MPAMTRCPQLDMLALSDAAPAAAVWGGRFAVLVEGLHGIPPRLGVRQP